MTSQRFALASFRSLVPLVVFALAPALDAQVFSIPANVNVGVGVAPNSITGAEGADLDGDGNGDIVAVDDAANGSIGVARGIGGGLYAAPVLSGPTGALTGAATPATADFDLDGVLDLAYSGLTAGGVPAVFIVRGNPGIPGGFITPPQVFAAGGAGSNITGQRTTDFTGDGNQDVVATVNGASRRLFIVHGSGGFVFGPLTSTNTMSGPQDVDICVDFNHDGTKDLAIVESGVLGNFVSVYPGSGIPSNPLGGPIRLPLPGSIAPLDVNWIDCDQDQSYDLAVSAEGAQNIVFLLKNLGAIGGFFTPSSVLPPQVVGSVPNSLLRLDVDADGYEDLSVLGVGTVGGNPVTVGFLKVSNCLAGNLSALAAGSVQPTVVAQEISQYHSVQDQNFDGKLDVMSVDQTGTNDVVKSFTNILPMSLTVSPARPLLGDVTPITFHIQVPAALSGQPCIILFSLAGTDPGLPMGGPFELPLNGPLLGLLIPSTIGPGGVRTITTLPVTFPAAPKFFSLQLWCAAVVQSTTPGVVGFVTNPAMITIP